MSQTDAESDHERRRSIRLLRRLLNRGRDDAIAALVAATPSVVSARRLLHLAQEASEDVSPPDQYARLFCLPLLMQFPEPVPASQVDAALGRCHQFGTPSAPCRACDIGTQDTEFVRGFFEAGDLVDLPLSVIREAAVALISHRGLALPPKHSFVRGERPQHRSRSLLRCLVGLRFSSAAMGVDSRRQIEHAIQQQLDFFDGMVRAWFDGSFQEALCTGVWMHQARRLVEVAAQRAPGVAAGSSFHSVTAEGTSLRPLIKVRFCETPEMCSTDYVLRCRPLEDRERARKRVTEILMRAGLSIASEFMPDSTS